MSSLMTIEQVAEYLRVRPGEVRTMIKRAGLRVRKDGLISERALTSFLNRRKRITRRWVRLCATGMISREAWRAAHEIERNRTSTR